MTEEPSQLGELPEAEGQQDTVGEAFAQLLADGRAYADAEIERQKIRAGIAGAAVRDAAIFGAAGIVLIFAGLVAFLVGLVLMLTPYIGAGWSAAAIFGASLLIALLLLLLAKARVSRMMKVIRS